SLIPKTRAFTSAHATALASPRTLSNKPPASRETLLTRNPTFISLRWRALSDIVTTLIKALNVAIPVAIVLRCDTAARPFAADLTLFARLVPTLCRNDWAQNFPQFCSWHLPSVSARHGIRK